MLELPGLALTAAKEYREAHADQKPALSFVAAESMYIQMLAANQKFEAAREAYDALVKACPAGCEGRLGSYLGSVYWALPPEQAEFSAEVLKTLVSFAESEGGDALAGARFMQGMHAMKSKDFEQALIAFLEAARLYESNGDRLGYGRAKYLELMAQVRREEPDAALKAGVEALKVAESVQDYRDVTDVYGQLAQLFMPRQGLKPGPYLAAAPDVLLAYVQCKLATGDEPGVAEALYGMGAFLLQVQQINEAQTSFQRAVYYSIRSARFDVAALSHLSLAVVARLQNNPEVFRDEIRRAKLMADISEDESIQQAIEEALQPPSEEPPDDPTQLL